MSTTPSAVDITNLEAGDMPPAMRQYCDLKRRYPDTLILFRMGDFYETFFGDAIKANKLIGITLTKRGRLKDGTPIPMAGVPFMSLDQYVSRLVRLGESVVIAEQIGTPGKGLMERRISRIITPGTLTDTALLPEKNDAILLSASREGGREAKWGLVWLTLSNGEFCACETSDAQLDTEIARIGPSEILVAEPLRDEFRAAHGGVTVTPMPSWHFDAEHGEELLKKTFGLAGLDAWGVEGRRGILAAANALLDYTQETQVDMMPFILPLKIRSASDYIVIDPASRRNLEISDSIRAEAKGPTLFSVLDTCATSMGSRELRRWLNMPLRDAGEARRRQSGVEALAGDRTFASELRSALAELPDVERTAGRIALGTARPKELAALRDALPAAAAIAALLKNRPESWLSEAAAALELPGEIGDLLRKALLDEPATLLREGDVIRSEYSEELRELRELRDNTGAFLMEFESREKAATGISALRVEYNRVAGFYIEVPKGQADKVPVTYHRKQTLKNVERFITPELKGFEDKAISAQERSAALERELYMQLVAALAPHVGALMSAAKAAAGLDAASALAAHAAERGWVKPELTDAPGIYLRKLRHPVVETAIETYVPSDCTLGDGRRCLIITGPNMGGKSTYMRAVALIAILAWAGSFVPAEAASIGPIDRIHTRIGASDDLAGGRSTFMVEMTEAAAILHQATDRSLVLMDEIGRGTATLDGLSLAAAIAEELVRTTRCLTLFATHYFELTRLAASVKEVANVHVSAVKSKSRIVFLHEVKDGPASQSFGIAVAQLAGVPAPVVRRAKGMLLKLESSRKAAKAPQADLFGEGLFIDEPDPAPIIEEEEAAGGLSEEAEGFIESTAALDVDSLSPREALAKLYEIKAAAQKIKS